MHGFSFLLINALIKIEIYTRVYVFHLFYESWHHPPEHIDVTDECTTILNFLGADNAGFMCSVGGVGCWQRARNQVVLPPSTRDEYKFVHDNKIRDGLRFDNYRVITLLYLVLYSRTILQAAASAEKWALVGTGLLKTRLSTWHECQETFSVGVNPSKKAISSILTSFPPPPQSWRMTQRYCRYFRIFLLRNSILTKVPAWKNVTLQESDTRVSWRSWCFRKAFISAKKTGLFSSLIEMRSVQTNLEMVVGKLPVHFYRVLVQFITLKTIL